MVFWSAPSGSLAFRWPLIIMSTYKSVPVIIVFAIAFCMSGCNADNQSSFDELTNKPEKRALKQQSCEDWEERIRLIGEELKEKIRLSMQTDAGWFEPLPLIQVWTEDEINRWENISQQRFPNDLDTRQ